MKTPIHTLIEMLARTVPAIKYGNAIDINFWLELEKDELRRFFVEGRKYNLDIFSDWKETSDLFYAETYKETAKPKLPLTQIIKDDLPIIINSITSTWQSEVEEGESASQVFSAAKKWVDKQIGLESQYITSLVEGAREVLKDRRNHTIVQVEEAEAIIQKYNSIDDLPF